ncbi:MAG: hypothetical protein IJ769_01140 [Clostridia bacterium]|nr:hypothetical protein [Clostridia bacterium]
MLGRYIDQIVFGGLFATILYLFFLNAWGSIPLAGALAFACVALGRWLLKRRPTRPRASSARVQAELLRLAGLSDAEAQAELTELVRARWPGEAFYLTPVLKHPEATLSSGDVLNAWKANRDAPRLVIAATCPAEPRALVYARELRAPAVAVVDSRALSRILRRHLPAPTPTPRVSLRQRLRRTATRIATSRVTPRNPLLAISLLALYLRGGNPLCLFASMLMLAHLGVALIQRRAGRRLFE